MNIFIAGLNYNMSEAELGELFAEYGEVVSVKIIMDRETGRSKGYGFVEMADDEAGDKAIAALNEVDMDGKTLSVSVARPREERPRRSYGNNGGGGYRGGNNSRGKRNNRQPKSFEDILNRHLKTCLSISNVQDRFPYIL